MLFEVSTREREFLLEEALIVKERDTESENLGFAGVTERSLICLADTR